MKTIIDSAYGTLLVIATVLIGSVVFDGFINAQGDLLKQSFQKVFEYDYAIDKEADDLFEGGQQLQIGGESGNYDSVVVRAGRLLIRISVLLAVPMLIYLGIKLALGFGDEAKMREVAKLGGNIIIGIFLAMLCVMIVYFITAFFRSNEKFIAG